MKTYITTKEQCEAMIEGRVCSCCGNPVQALETVDNAGRDTFWGGCLECSRLDWGVIPYVFKIAEKMVREKNYIHYSYMGSVHNYKTEPEITEWYKSQISGATSMVRDVLTLTKEVKK